MWVHVAAILGIVFGAIGWWVLQYAAGGERLEKCVPGTDGCSGCGVKTPECGADQFK